MPQASGSAEISTIKPERTTPAILYGCINVPAAFYDGYVKPALGSRRRGVDVVPDEAKNPLSGFSAIHTGCASALQQDLARSTRKY